MISEAAHLVPENIHWEARAGFRLRRKADILLPAGMRTDSLFLHQQIIPLMF